jgi:molybdenum-dependent DNA-binding transcriptional regulator ModE
MARSNIDDFRLSIRLDFASGVPIGPGKIALLEKGSISGAARKMGMAYRKAWLLVEQMNQLLGQPVVTTACITGPDSSPAKEKNKLEQSVGC